MGRFELPIKAVIHRVLRTQICVKADKYSFIRLYHVLKFLQRTDFYDVASWLSLEHRCLACEGINAFTLWRGGLVLYDDLAQTRQGEGLWTLLAQGFRDFIVQGVEHSADVLFSQTSGFGNVVVNLCLRRWFLCCGLCHFGKPSLVLTGGHKG